MLIKHPVLTAALAAAFAIPLAASAADSKAGKADNKADNKADKQELAAIRAQIAQMQQSYETRLRVLEQRLEDAQAARTAGIPAPTAPIAGIPTPGIPTSGSEIPGSETPGAQAAIETAPPAAAPAAANAFNPNISLVLGGTLANLSQDPASYRLQGFVPPAGEVGPGRRGFNLGESELTFAANIDPMFAGQLTFSLSGENSAGVEEAFVQTRALSNGLNLRAGRFLSSVGYLNSQHAHTWDFVDAPLAYQAFFGGQYKPDGVQARWLAPTDTFVEIGAELGSGAGFPGNDRNKNGAGSAALFVHAGDDIGSAGSWRAGLSYLRTGATERAFDEAGLGVAFSGRAEVAIADAIYKWAPNGNPTSRNFKLQGEYFRRRESGALRAGDPGSAGGAGSASGAFDSTQSGWYAQAVYQFMPNWRTGLRYDRLDAGSPVIGLLRDGLLAADALPSLAPYHPARASLMVDYSPSEFARLRLQVARERSRPGAVDNEIFLQYIMSLGTHAAHAF